jgi:alpha-N-arabinofuranosidase
MSRHGALMMISSLMGAKSPAARLAMLCCIAACFGRISAAQTSSIEQTSININARKILHSIPRSIYGTFLEPIGNSTYNGLWAEILQNPSFEDNLWEAKQIAEMVRDRPELATSSGMSLPLPWEPLDYKQGTRYAPESSEPANSHRSLLLLALPTQETGIRQRVYLPVHRTTTYVGSVYLKLVSGPPQIQISIRQRNHSDRVFGRQLLDLRGADWKRYAFSLKIPQGEINPLEPADFVISANNETRVAPFITAQNA